jgi:hypothetical protein
MLCDGRSQWSLTWCFGGSFICPAICCLGLSWQRLSHDRLSCGPYEMAKIGYLSTSFNIRQCKQHGEIFLLPSAIPGRRTCLLVSPDLAEVSLLTCSHHGKSLESDHPDEWFSLQHQALSQSLHNSKIQQTAALSRAYAGVAALREVCCWGNWKKSKEVIWPTNASWIKGTPYSRLFKRSGGHTVG